MCAYDEYLSVYLAMYDGESIRIPYVCLCVCVPVNRKKYSAYVCMYACLVLLYLHIDNIYMYVYVLRKIFNGMYLSVALQICMYVCIYEHTDVLCMCVFMYAHSAGVSTH